MLRLYKGDQASPLLHPIDAKNWILMGWSEESPTSSQSKEPDPVPHKAPILPALTLINSANTAEEVSVLPSIGMVTAQTILDARPDGGYNSLEAVAEVEGTSRVQWDEVEAWE